MLKCLFEKDLQQLEEQLNQELDQCVKVIPESPSGSECDRERDFHRTRREAEELDRWDRITDGGNFRIG